MRCGPTAAIVAVVVLALLTSLALAAEVTRDSYREAVEPICKANTEANERIFKGVRAMVRQNKLKPAANRFEKAKTALQRALSQLRAVPQPAADTARLAKWLSDVNIEAELFGRVATQLRAGQKSRAEHTVLKLTVNANRANNLVIGFEFTYCRFEPSRFT